MSSTYCALPQTCIPETIDQLCENFPPPSGVLTAVGWRRGCPLGDMRLQSSESTPENHVPTCLLVGRHVPHRLPHNVLPWYRRVVLQAV